MFHTLPHKLPADHPHLVSIRPPAAPAFVIAKPDNSATITLGDNAGRVKSERWIIARGAKAIAYAVFCFAMKHQIPQHDVNYSVIEGA